MKKGIKKWLMKVDIERVLSFGFNSQMPQRQIAIGYLSYILLGALILCLPISNKTGVGFIDNLFNATSAVSTTGLCTKSLNSDYTTFGQIILLILIQFGGIGYMTVSSFIMFKLTHHFMRIKNGVMNATFSMPKDIDMKTMVQNIIYFTIGFEVVGTILLYILFLDAGMGTPLWSAFFHSVSSFCTAGFALYDDSFCQFRSNIGVNTVISILSYAGAMGFIVMHDIWQKMKNRNYKITFTTKVIVAVTVILSVWGTLQIVLTETHLSVYPLWERIMIALFHSMSAMTTVGFNTIPLGNMLTPTLMFLIFAMYLGGSPSGTGGGLKSTTLSAVIAFIISKLSMKRDIYLFNHRIPTYRVDNALTLFCAYTSILFFGVFAMTFFETDALTALLFEAASALGTVGLSTGITADLHDATKIILTCMMYIGRIGILTFGNVMLLRMRESRPKERVNIDDDLAV